ncbi:c-type cytochrome [Pseudoprimorskyibacter insulae]|uniref:Fructose dehydrogenase cytochrome subunit n=1 Tax=Pseudoprimorskyibacter insulae TaxID=1695997 RepID=A0A2R8AWK5_9RHOB|nr:c-type cytochrome [Pseudoprimorskyibacter insulae]SPF80425.1 Fructose dehydrogenase cytochrome subunit [Pseudoprimorskyibacter insulae]
MAALCVAAAGLFVTRPAKLPDGALDGLSADPANGEQVFYAAGCISCHAAPGTTGPAKLTLAGGQAFPSDFGTFIAPNISPDPDHGIGGWTLSEFASALRYGSSPDGQHYYPAFPYTAYAHMTDQDIADLWAFWQGLPPSDVPSQPHQVGFPFNIRASLGGWKMLFMSKDWVVADIPSPEVERGRYLVEALGHCGECHTPRNALGGLDTANWLGGAPNPSGSGKIPSLAALDWAASDIAYYLETGFTPDFDSAGGHMAPVVQNFARLPAADRDAVAAYIKALQ